MPVKSRPFGPVEITGKDAKRFKDKFITVEELIENLGITEAEMETHHPLARAAIERIKREGAIVTDITDDSVPYSKKPEEKD